MEQSFQKGAVLHLASLIEYAEGGVISKQLIKSPAGNITLFSFDKGEEKNIINLEQCAELLQVLKTRIKNVEIYYNPYTTKLEGEIEGAKIFNIITQEEV